MTKEQREIIIKHVGDTLLKAMHNDLHVAQIAYIDPFNTLNFRTVYSDDVFEVILSAKAWNELYRNLGFEFGLYVDGVHEDSFVKEDK